MAKTNIYASHPDLLPKSTILAAEASAGANVSCTVANTGYGSTRSTDDVFANSDFVVFGYPGQQYTELAKINATVSSATSFQVDDLEHSHPNGTSIHAVDYDRIELWGSTSETGTYVSVSVSPVNISWHLPYTILTESAGTYTWFKYKYYDSVGLTYSAFSPAIEGTTLERGMLRWIIERVRLQGKLKGDFPLKDEDIIKYINDAQQVIFNALAPKFINFAQTEQDLTTVADTSRYALPSDFHSMNYVVYNKYESATNHTRPFLKEVRMQDMYAKLEDQTQESSDDLEYYAMEGQSYINIYPIPETASRTIYIYYNKYPSDLTTDTSYTIIPDPTLVVDQVLMQLSDFSKHISYNKVEKRYATNLWNIRRNWRTNARAVKGIHLKTSPLRGGDTT